MDENSTTTIEEIIPRMPRASLVIAGVFAALFSALPATPYGGLLCFVIATALLGLLLIAEPSFLAFIPIPLSYIAAVLMTRDPVTSLLAFLTVPGAFALRVCYAKKRSLSVTLVALSVCMGVSFGIMLYFSLTSAYGGSIKEALISVRDYVYSAVDSLFETVKQYAQTVGGDMPLAEFSEDSVFLIKRMLIMIIPGMYAVLIELSAYCAEKLMRLFSRLFRCPWVSAVKNRVTLSLGAAVIYVVSYGISSLFPGDSVIYYSAENLMLIVLPLAAVAGIHSMFGKDSLFRRKGTAFIKVITILLCVMAFYVSPIMLFILFALWGSASAISRALFLHAINKRNGQ